MAGHGSAPGERRGGRKKGVPNKATLAKESKIAAEGLTPLELMLAVVRNKDELLATRLDAAKSAAPYVHPRLTSVEVGGMDKRPLEFRDVTEYTDEQRARALAAFIAKQAALDAQKK